MIDYDILPDSRLSSNVGAVVVDWKMPDGSFVRCECIPVYCANCGASGGYVPKDNTTFAFYLCVPCSETHGAPANTMLIPDEVFYQAVAEEMQEHYGRQLTALETLRLAELGWGPLASLIKESPIKY